MVCQIKPVESVCIRIAWDLDLFHLLSTGAKTLQKLAQATEVDAVLLTPLLRSSAAFGAITESGQSYTLSSSYALFADSNFTKEIALPKFLADTKYMNSTDPKNTVVQTAFQCRDKDLFGILGEKPVTAQAFAALMSTWAKGTSLVQDLFPMGQFLAGGNSSSSALWVDVGGGYGQKTVALRSAFPVLEGRFVVQDLDHIIRGADRKEGIEYMVHDIFTDQPVIGARAYYIRQVLHDLPDDKCVAILTRLRKAMKPGYSKLFIHEQIVPKSGAAVWTVTQDFNMMTLLGAAERTRDCFSRVLSRSGLKVLGFYSALDGVSEGLVEVEVEVEVGVVLG
ncbi:hypothetical protein BOTCAL_0263g00100 [Botryotinia calthae]|uniref:O-methyltransferase C-terminal domain-containing protein n=1 Tax=Botryotinia calthae TaxID=38488 RepID=A0A4Y8CYN1_9HELO|nr:hypothetical protein BOTCAL_0263g00100 [Botryotinia calthae]